MKFLYLKLSARTHSAARKFVKMSKTNASDMNVVVSASKDGPSMVSNVLNKPTVLVHTMACHTM